MSRLLQLIESACKREDGTVADLGAVPTGHKRPKDDKNVVHVNEDTVAYADYSDGKPIVYSLDGNKDDGLFLSVSSPEDKAEIAADGGKLFIRDKDLIYQSPGKEEKKVCLRGIIALCQATIKLAEKSGLLNEEGMIK